MVDQTGFKFLVTLAIFLFCAPTKAVHLRLSNNYILDYYRYNNDSYIEFQIQAINVTGWVGIGINEVNPNLLGVDLFLGGYDYFQRKDYGFDMHVPLDSTDNFPLADSEKNWSFGKMREENNATYLIVRRPLISPDKANDTDIPNRPINLIWAYNEVYDSYYQGPTKWGSHSVNLLVGSGGGVPTTTPATTTTKSGSNTIQFKLFNLLIVIASAFMHCKYINV